MSARLTCLVALVFAAGCGADTGALPCDPSRNIACPSGYTCQDKVCRPGTPRDAEIDHAPVDAGPEAPLVDAGPEDAATDALPGVDVVLCTSAADCAAGLVCDLTTGGCVSPSLCPSAGATLYVDVATGSDLGNGSMACPLATLTAAEADAAASAASVMGIMMAAGTYTDQPSTPSGARESFPIALAANVAVTGSSDPKNPTSIVAGASGACLDGVTGTTCALYARSGGVTIAHVVVQDKSTGGRGLVFDGGTGYDLASIGVLGCGQDGVVVEGSATAKLTGAIVGLNGANGVLVTGGASLIASSLFDGVSSDGVTDLHNTGNGIDVEGPSTLSLAASNVTDNDGDGLFAATASAGGTPTISLSGSTFLHNGRNGIEAVDAPLNADGTTMANTVNAATASLRNSISGICLRHGTITTPPTVDAKNDRWSACPPAITYSSTCAIADVTEPVGCATLWTAACVQASPCGGTGP